MPLCLVFAILLASQPPTAAPDATRQALELYARGLRFEQGSDLLKALAALEEARKLDPQTAPVHKALARLYLALDRRDEALAASAKALELDPRDADTALFHARQLRHQRRPGDAAAVFERILTTLGPREQPYQRAQLALELAALGDELNDAKRSEAALRQALAALAQRETLLETDKVPAAELDTLTAETWERLATACTRQNKTAEALAAYDRALALAPGWAARLALPRSALLEQQGNLIEALRAVEEHLRTRPTGTEAYERKLSVLRGLGRGGEGIAFLEGATGREPGNGSLQVLLAKEYARYGRPQDAENHLRQILATVPTPEVATALLDRMKGRANDGEQVLELLDKLIHRGTDQEEPGPPRPGKASTKVPGDPAAAAQARALLVGLKRDPDLTGRLLQAATTRMLGGRKLDFATRSLLAPLAARTGQLPLAERLYRTCLETGGRNAEPELYGGLLRVLATGHKHKEVVALCQEGIANSEQTNHVLFHLEMSRALMALGRSEEALATAQRAVDESNDNARLATRRNRVLLLAEAGKLAEAVADCHALLREYKTPADAEEIRYVLSAVYSLGGDLEKAEAQLRLVLASNPDDATACNDLGYHHAERNRNLEEAERLVRRAIELDRKQRNSGLHLGTDSDVDNAAYLDSLGWVLFRRGKLAEARRELERATTLPGGADDPVIWDHLGDVLARLDDRPAARAAYQKALSQYEAGYRRRPAEAPAEIRNKLRLLQP